MTTFGDIGVGHALAHDGCWEHPLLVAALSAGTKQRVRDLLGGAEKLLAMMESMAVTLAHHDTQPSNFFIRDPSKADSRTVTIDWGFVGLAPVGHDLGCHIWSNLATWTVDPRQAGELDRGSSAAYLQGLRDFGWDRDENTVLFTRAACAALATATSLTEQVSELCDQTTHYLGTSAWPQKFADRQRLSVETLMGRWAAGLNYALDLGDEAQRLRASLG
jgi:Phosphotransferase enzyme family